MISSETIINIEIMTEQLNDMYARVSEFIIQYPANNRIPKLREMSSRLAVAHQKSRIYTDEKHAAEWEDLLKQAKDLISEAEVSNVLTGF